MQSGFTTSQFVRLFHCHKCGEVQNTTFHLINPNNILSHGIISTCACTSPAERWVSCLSCRHRVQQRDRRKHFNTSTGCYSQSLLQNDEDGTLNNQNFEDDNLSEKSEEYTGNGLGEEESQMGEIPIGDWKSNAWPGNPSNVTYLPVAAKEYFTAEDGRC